MVSGAPALAGWQEETGLTGLRALLGASAVDGSGVLVTQGEALVEENYLPEFGVNPIAGTGSFGSKTFTDLTESAADTGASSHARTVGSFWYGANPATGAAPGIREIQAISADDFTGSGFLDPDGDEPEVETGAVQNHSWIGSGSDDLLRRFDFAIDRDGFVACVGLNNGSTTPVPELLASAFNVVSVGLTDGNHSRGGTPADRDGAGRTRPALVVPVDRTSWGTAVTSGFAAILAQLAAATPSPAVASRPEVIKALLLAGATKGEFPGWSQSPEQPLDPVHGAGEANILRSYQILAAGRQAPTTTVPAAAARGWDLRPTDPAEPVTYTFRVADGSYARDFSLVATWHRTVTDTSPGRRFTPEAALVDIDLALSRSDRGGSGVTIATSASPIDNVEHIYRPWLAPGEYRIQVTAPEAVDFAAAWTADAVAEADLPLEVVGWEIDGAAGTLTVEWSGVAGRVYAIEFSTALDAWSPASGSTTVVAEGGSATTSATVPVPSAGDGRLFFRVADVTP